MSIVTMVLMSIVGNGVDVDGVDVNCGDGVDVGASSDSSLLHLLLTSVVSSLATGHQSERRGGEDVCDHGSMMMIQ